MARHYALLLGLLFSSNSAFAQLTITQNNYLIPPGTYSYTSLFSDDQDGTNTESNAESINDLIARSGANQTWDFRAIVFSEQASGEAVITTGAVGPASEDPLFATASHTWSIPFLELFEDEEGGTARYTGSAYNYVRITSSEARNLGLYSEGEYEAEGEDPVDMVVTLRNEPDGSIDAVFPMTYGTTWTTSYEQPLELLPGFVIENDVTATYVVDGWGTLIGPGMATPVPALRLKVNTTITTTMPFPGFPPQVTESESYEFRTIVGIAATIGAGGEEDEPWASFSITGTGAVTTEPDRELGRFQLAPAYPNPFTQSTSFDVVLPQPTHLRVTVHDVLGREVLRIVDGPVGEGRHPFALHAEALPNGMYLIRAEAGGWIESVRISLVR